MATSTSSAVLKAASAKKAPAAAAPVAPEATNVPEEKKAPAYTKRTVTEFYNSLVTKMANLEAEYARRKAKIQADMDRYESKHAARVNAAKMLLETGKSKDEAIDDLNAQIQALMQTRRGLRQA